MNISTSIGIYDFLNYLVIGAILSFIFVPWIPQNATTLVLWAIPCFIVGLIFHKVIESLIGKYTRNNKKLILSAFRKEAQYCDKKINEPILIEKEYYRAYYSLLEKNLLGNIPRLEAISSFFQDLFFIVLFYTSFLLYHSIYYKGFSLYIIYNCIVYGIPYILCFLLTKFSIPRGKWLDHLRGKWFCKYPNCTKYEFYSVVILFFISSTYFGFTLYDQLYQQIQETFTTNFHPALILANESITTQLLLSLPLLLLFLFLRNSTEKKIFTLVWEGYIFMCLNKKDIIN